MKMNDKMFIVTHKKLDKIIKKKGFSYIQVGNKVKNYDYEYKDSKGDNISFKNKNYCELTALYWIWKNYECSENSVIGFCHYRRFFSFLKLPYKMFFVSLQKAKKYLNKYDVILPKKFKFSTTVYNYYFLGQGKKKDLDMTRTIISKLYPEYLPSFDEFSKQNTGHYCNMIICQKKFLDSYCKWLFEILFELEKVTDLTGYSDAEARIYGYISEYLLNVYVLKNKYKIKELNIINTEIPLRSKILRKIKKFIS